MTPPVDGGLLLVDKPGGVTSHDVVGRVRRLLWTRRVGHAGTLDPMATGLLILAVERSTRLLGYLSPLTKTYTATVRLGIATDSDDADGSVVEVVDASAVTADEVAAGIRSLTGALMQIPSTVSAVRVDGRRAYERARAGEAVILAPRPVTVGRFDVVAPMRPSGSAVDVDVIVDCSAGTYIRALARDLGRSLGVGGHLTRLRRSRIGPFDVAEAVDVFDQAESGPQRAPVDPSLAAAVGDRVIPAEDAARRVFPVRFAAGREVDDLRFGRVLAAAGITGTYAVLDPDDGGLLALAREADGWARPVLVWRAAG